MRRLRVWQVVTMSRSGSEDNKVKDARLEMET
jgi:hypothetical protein